MVSVNYLQEKVCRCWLAIQALILIMPLTGFSWLFGLLSLITDCQLLYGYIFSILNSLQGFFILLFHCLMQTDVRKRLKRKFSGRIDSCTRVLPNRSSQLTLSYHITADTISVRSAPVDSTCTQVYRPSTA